MMIKNKSILMEVNGINVQLSRKRIKNMNLRIDAQAQVKMSVPLTCSLFAIENFLKEKQAWIEHHREKLLSRFPKPQSQLIMGDACFFLGKTYFLFIDENAKQQKITLEGERLCFYLKKSMSTDKKQRLLQQWYRQQMQALIPNLLKKWEAIIGVKVHQWGVKVMKTRWGSCNPVIKRIWLNLHLIEKPLVCLEYVLVHELVHLLEASHNKRFYALMSQFMPDWPKYRKLLKNF